MEAKKYLYMVVGEETNHQFTPGTLVETDGELVGYGCSDRDDEDEESSQACAQCYAEYGYNWYVAPKDLFLIGEI